MTYQTEYQKKLLSAEQAVQLIPRRGTISMGMAVSEPPTLLRALEQRLQHPTDEAIEELQLYYMHSERPSRETILKYEYMDIIKPHSFFISTTERALLERGKRDGKKNSALYAGKF